MPLEMRKSSKWWYGRYNVGNKIYCVNLDLEIEGKRPASMRQDGDGEFERSRGAAKAKLAEMLADIHAKRKAADYVQRLHEIRTGKKIESVPLPRLAAEWDKAARKRKGSPRYVQQAHSLFARFAAFMEARYPDAKTMADVIPEMAEAFMLAERERGVSGRTCNATLILLRSAFKALKNRANIAQNPFEGIVTMTENTTHRQPFTEEELLAILKAAGDDEFIRPVIVTGIFTAMRRGDCCTLRWGDVDLVEGFVRVKTSKTGETVEIPVFPLLYDELRHQLALLAPKTPEPEDYVFPAAAKMMLENPDGISYRIRKVFEKAGFYDDEAEEDGDEDQGPVGPALREVEKPALIERVEAMLASLTDTAPQKRERMAEAFRRYEAGESLPAVAKSMGISKSSVSLYLHEIEDRTGLRVITRLKKPKAQHRGVVRKKQADGLRRVSVRDFHSFRTTWITLALSAGVPLELVQRVTGHKTTQVVLKHYFKPGRDAFKKAIESAMPQLLPATAETTAEPAQTPLDEALEILEHTTARTWMRDRDKVMALIRQRT